MNKPIELRRALNQYRAHMATFFRNNPEQAQLVRDIYNAGYEAAKAQCSREVLNIIMENM